MEAGAPGKGSIAAGGSRVGNAAPGETRHGAATPSNQAPVGRPVVIRPRRTYYDVVAVEAEPGEELVYGEAATAVIVQWREARGAFVVATDSLDVLNAREQCLELEIMLIEEHKLTLPPATYPWDWGDRRQEVRRRTGYLAGIRVERNQLKLRRFLTFGLWRN